MFNHKRGRLFYKRFWCVVVDTWWSCVHSSYLFSLDMHGVIEWEAAVPSATSNMSGHDMRNVRCGAIHERVHLRQINALQYLCRSEEIGRHEEEAWPSLLYTPIDVVDNT